MSHVSALPVPTSSGGFSSALEDTTVEAAMTALQNLPNRLLEYDPLDATVGVIGVAAAMRLLYMASKHPTTVRVLESILVAMKKVKS